MLSVPEHARILELPTSTVWLEDSGIVGLIAKRAQPQSVEQARESLKAFLEFVGHKKVCLLIDVTDSTENTREMRTYAAEELPRVAKAIAIVSTSALGKMVANLFFHLKSQPYPAKMFNAEAEARDWLKNYL